MKHLLIQCLMSARTVEKDKLQLRFESTICPILFCYQKVSEKRIKTQKRWGRMQNQTLFASLMPNCVVASNHKRLFFPPQPRLHHFFRFYDSSNSPWKAIHACIYERGIASRALLVVIVPLSVTSRLNCRRQHPRFMDKLLSSRL